jgi:SAM-dependent methyltransferase
MTSAPRDRRPPAAPRKGLRLGGARFAAELDDAAKWTRFAAFYDRVDRTVATLAGLGLRLVWPEAAPDRALSLEQGVRHVAPRARYLLRSLLAIRFSAGGLDWLDGGRFVMRAPAGSRDGTEVISAAAEETGHDPLFRVLELWWNGLDDFFAGRRTGVEILFPRGDLSAWAALHDRSLLMRHYADLAAALTLARVVPCGRVLEIGGGTGATCRRVLAEPGGRALSAYDFTDVSAAFLTAMRPVSAATPLRTRRLDFDLDLRSQGFEAAAYDLVLGVNALHVAQDLIGATERVASLLRPGGWLVLGEGSPGRAGHRWRADPLFALLDGWWNVKLDPVMRPRSGFLDLQQWQAVLRRSGLDLDPSEAQSRFRTRWFGGAFAARRPG